MDRPEPGLVKWSPNADHDSFLHVNLQHRVVQLYKPTGFAKHGRFDYEKLSKHDDFPPLTTFDWSPTSPGLLAVGTGSGVIDLLRIDDNSNAYTELGLKMTRTCQAVAFNTQGLLAVGLDRVRMDQSLHIWDVNRLSSLGQSVSGFPLDAAPLVESVTRLEPSVLGVEHQVLRGQPADPGRGNQGAGPSHPMTCEVGVVPGCARKL